MSSDERYESVKKELERAAKNAKSPFPVRIQTFGGIFEPLRDDVYTFHVRRTVDGVRFLDGDVDGRRLQVRLPDSNTIT